MNEIATKKPVPMSVALASSFTEGLCKSLQLSQEQMARAKSSALTLSSNANLNGCDPFSLIKFCFETARYNFTRDDYIYPVPYKDNKNGGVKKVQAQLGYKGFVELALRSNKYSAVSASMVKEGDKVYRDPETGEVRVKFSEDINAIDGETIGYFAWAKDTAGKLVQFAYMSKKQIEGHRSKYSKAYGESPWDKEFDKMALKTVIKQLCKSLATTPELNAAIKQDQVVYGTKGESDTYLDNPWNDAQPTKGRTQVTAPIIEEEPTADDNGEVSQEALDKAAVQIDKENTLFF